MRTTDTEYGKDYWATLDGGRGYHDSVMWQDLAFIIHHAVAMDHKTGEDRCAEFRHVDVGCGAGFLTLNMRKRGFESFGLDLSEYALSIAPEGIRQYLYQFDLAWVNDSHFGRGEFPFLTCFETLEHIEGQFADRAVGHIRNLMTPGGVAVLTICVIGQPGSDDDPTHVNVVDRSYWLQKFEKHKFYPEQDIEAELMRFHLFESHKGVFVLRKPHK